MTRTPAAVGADEPAEALRLDLLGLTQAFLDSSLDAVAKLLEPDELRTELHRAPVPREVRAADRLRVVLRHLVRVVLSTPTSESVRAQSAHACIRVRGLGG